MLTRMTNPQAEAGVEQGAAEANAVGPVEEAVAARALEAPTINEKKR